MASIMIGRLKSVQITKSRIKVLTSTRWCNYDCLPCWEARLYAVECQGPENAEKISKYILQLKLHLIKGESKNGTQIQEQIGFFQQYYTELFTRAHYPPHFKMAVMIFCIENKNLCLPITLTNSTWTTCVAVENFKK